MISIGRVRPSLNEFKVFFNEKSQKIRPELMIKHIEVNQKVYNPLFFIQMNQMDAILGSISRYDGAIKQIALLRQNDGTGKSRFEFIVAVTLLFEALLPNIEIKQKSKILESINFFKDGFDFYNANFSTTLSDMGLTLLSSMEGGFFSLCISFF